MGVPTALMQRLLLVSSPSRAGIGIIPVSPRTAPRHPAAEVGVLRKKRITGICFTPAHQGKKKSGFGGFLPALGSFPVLLCSSPDLSRLAQQRPRCSNWDFLGYLVVLSKRNAFVILALAVPSVLLALLTLPAASGRSWMWPPRASHHHREPSAVTFQ